MTGLPGGAAVRRSEVVGVTSGPEASAPGLARSLIVDRGGLLARLRSRERVVNGGTQRRERTHMMYERTYSGTARSDGSASEAKAGMTT